MPGSDHAVTILFHVEPSVSNVLMCAVHNQIVYEIVTHMLTVSAVYQGIFSTECTEISIVT